MRPCMIPLGSAPYHLVVQSIYKPSTACELRPNSQRVHVIPYDIHTCIYIPRGSKTSNNEYLAQTIFINPYIETQGPHYNIGIWTLRDIYIYIYFGRKMLSIRIHWGPSISSVGAWTLWDCGGATGCQHAFLRGEVWLYFRGPAEPLAEPCDSMARLHAYDLPTSAR